MIENDGGPAFPLFDAGGQDARAFMGMSLRDYFAGQALVSGDCPSYPYKYDERAEWCYDQADAMLKAREAK